MHEMHVLAAHLRPLQPTRTRRRTIETQPQLRHSQPVGLGAGIGANLVSAAFEKTCTLLVGASGAVFGFMGLFVADLVINFESIAWPFLRILIILLFVIFFVVNAIIDDSPQRVSHASHIGGLVCGLFPSLLFLPNLRNKRLKALQRQVAEGGGPAEGATTKCAPVCCARAARCAVLLRYW